VHFAQRLEYLLQPFAHLREALGQAAVKRVLQLLVHSVAHFLQLLRVFSLQFAQRLLQRFAQALHPRLVLLQACVQRRVHGAHPRFKSGQAFLGQLMQPRLPPIQRAIMLISALLPRAKQAVLHVRAAVDEPRKAVADGLQRAQLLLPLAQALLVERPLHRTEALVQLILDLAQVASVVHAAPRHGHEHHDQQQRHHQQPGQHDQLPRFDIA